MAQVDQDRVMSVFAEAAELPAADRAAFLDSTCSGEPELRREVEELLTCAEPAAAVFEAASQHIVQPDPDRIGAYDIIEPIGEGGMAVVYRARQNHPVRRTVALKLVKLGMDTRQFVARFESERQALAMMDHPNVARVYDAGSTDTGRPYFVMEYVPGEPLLDYCDRHNLNLCRRLDLFVVVCEAVEHAHRKGIIHRDLKNSNVLVAEVDGRPVPKVIDFGVAKAIDEPLSERAIQTEQGQLIGTPEYMSPEQADRGAADVDTRADVYSLGVLMYELVAGVPPIASDILRGGSLEQVRRLIRDGETPRPSTRLSTLGGADAARIAQRRSTALPTLIRNLRSELEWIPLKAMRKDREQRYRSAAELADDVRNYLGGRPLIAGPESGWYRARKFLRRHKAGVAASAAMVLLLVAGVIVASLLTVRARRAEAQARAERDNARATLDFLTDRVLSGASPEKIPDAKVRDQIVKAMIEPAAASVGDSFKDRPVIEASIRDAIQSVLREIGRSDLALPHAEAALSIRRRELGDDHIDTIQSINDCGRVLRALGRFADAEPFYKEALDRRTRVQGEDHADALSSLNNYAGILERLGRKVDAEPLFKRALDRRRVVLGEDHVATITSLNNYAHILHEQGKVAEAEPLYRDALDRRRRLQGEDHPLTLLAINNLADALTRLGRIGEAEPLYLEALERYRRVMGPEHPTTLTAISNYAFFLSRAGRDNDANRLYQQVLEQRRRVLGEEHPETLFSLSQYAESLRRENRLAEAEPLVRRAIEIQQRRLGETHPDTIKSVNLYATLLMSLGRAADALPLFGSVRQVSSRVNGADHDLTLVAMSNEANALLHLDRAGEAEAIARDALERSRASPSLGPRHELTVGLANVLARCLDALGRTGDGDSVRREFGLPGATSGPSSAPSTRTN